MIIVLGGGTRPVLPKRRRKKIKLQPVWAGVEGGGETPRLPTDRRVKGAVNRTVTNPASRVDAGGSVPWGTWHPPRRGPESGERDPTSWYTCASTSVRKIPRSVMTGSKATFP